MVVTRPAGLAGTLHVLGPGDLACGQRGDRFETLLGSCVAVVLTDPRRTAGAMCHIVHAGAPRLPLQPGAPRLPLQPGAPRLPMHPGAPRLPASDSLDTAYAEVALATMRRRLRERGLVVSRCEAWVFGGGNMFPQLATQQEHVGQRNVTWVLEALLHEGVRLLGHDIGGPCYRRLAWTVGPDLPELTAVPV